MNKPEDARALASVDVWIAGRRQPAAAGATAASELNVRAPATKNFLLNISIVSSTASRCGSRFKRGEQPMRGFVLTALLTLPRSDCS